MSTRSSLACGPTRRCAAPTSSAKSTQSRFVQSDWGYAMALTWAYAGSGKNAARLVLGYALVCGRDPPPGSTGRTCGAAGLDGVGLGEAVVPLVAAAVLVIFVAETVGEGAPETVGEGAPAAAPAPPLPDVHAAKASAATASAAAAASPIAASRGNVRFIAVTRHVFPKSERETTVRARLRAACIRIASSRKRDW